MTTRLRSSDTLRRRGVFSTLVRVVTKRSSVPSFDSDTYARQATYTYPTSRRAYKFRGRIKINQNSSGHNSSPGDINATANRAFVRERTHWFGADRVYERNVARPTEMMHARSRNREEEREREGERGMSGEEAEPRDVFADERRYRESPTCAKLY